MTARPTWAQPVAPRRRRAAVNDPLNPLEHVEQRRLADYLRARGDLLWTHVPNESKRGARQGRALKEAGMQRGVPDVLIFNPFPLDSRVNRTCRACAGLAIELKRVRGKGPTLEQRWWAEQLALAGWRWDLCRGADAAIKVIEQAYGPPSAAGRRAA